MQQINRSLLRGRDHKIQLWPWAHWYWSIDRLKIKSLMPLIKTRPARKNVDRILCKYRKIRINSYAFIKIWSWTGRDGLESRTNVSVSSRHWTYQSRSRLVSKFETRRDRDREKSRLVRNTRNQCCPVKLSFWILGTVLRSTSSYIDFYTSYLLG